MKKVGIIGLGNMGYPIYQAIQNEFAVTCYDPYNKNKEIPFEPVFSNIDLTSS